MLKIQATGRNVHDFSFSKVYIPWVRLGITRTGGDNSELKKKFSKVQMI